MSRYSNLSNDSNRINLVLHRDIKFSDFGYYLLRIRLPLPFKIQISRSHNWRIAAKITTTTKMATTQLIDNILAVVYLNSNSSCTSVKNRNSVTDQCINAKSLHHIW